MARGPFPGYRLLTEYFAFPQKILVLRSTRLEGMAAMPPQQDAELLLFLNRAAPQLETRVNADSFRLALCSDCESVYETG